MSSIYEAFDIKDLGENKSKDFIYYYYIAYSLSDSTYSIWDAAGTFIKSYSHFTTALYEVERAMFREPDLVIMHPYQGVYCI